MPRIESVPTHTVKRAKSMRLVHLLLPLLGSFATVHAQEWSLSGKVVDAEEGNGLGSVSVVLAQAGLRATTAKNGDWSLVGGTGVRGSATRARRASESFLHLEKGRLLLRMDGLDILGRGVGSEGSASVPTPAPAAARAAAGVSDTLVYTRDGYVTKRVPLVSKTIAGLRDSIRRIRYEGWVDSSHSNGFKPDTTDAFPDTLRQITFQFTKANWDRMMKAMADSCGKFGMASSGGGFGGPSTTCQAGQYDLIENSALIWVPVDLRADGQVWKNVAIRLKGNASLQSSWTKGSYSLPFRINTDKYEDSFPTIRNQRFHGFKKISFYNLQQDSSGVRGAVAGEVFRQAGVPAPISVPVRIRLDRGDGAPLDVGIYEMLEVPDGPLLNRWFGNDSGNLYKPLSKLDAFVDSEWVDEDVKGDYSDAKALIAAINAANRTSDPAAWRANLEKILDAKAFLKWLAVSTAIMNWDAYGALAHNYYVFDDRGVFRWITYDFGWSFDYQMATSGIVSRTSIWYDQAGGGFFNLGPFPLVTNLLADPVYCEEYRAQMVAAIATGGPAGLSSVQEKVDRYGKMVSSLGSTVSPVKTVRAFMSTRIPEINASLSNKTCPIRK